jgi:hypothetical protein
MVRFLSIVALLLALPAIAQDRQGRDTPGEWIVDHFQSFGLWDSICDYRVTGDLREERCYIRYVDVFSPHPKFAAQFLFLTPGPNIELGVERGTRFTGDGIRIEHGTAVNWKTDDRDCLRGHDCNFSGNAASTLVNTMSGGGTFIFEFRDRNGDDQALHWDLAPFADALADFRTEASARSL